MIISLIAFTVVFSIIVLIHELGHFIAARVSGVKVYEFSIGFPFSPKVVTLFKHRETEFTLRLLPLGGFVSFSEGVDEEANGLFEASYFKRALILSAGSLLNVIFAFLVFITVFMLGKNIPFSDAVLMSAEILWEILAGTALLISNLITGNGSMEGLAGPVGIASLAGQAASKGFINLMYFTGLLSMSLGIMNLLPLPALDGGQLSMLFIEAIRQKPLSLKTYQVVTVLGMSLFIILTVIVTYRDIVRLVV